MTEEEKYYHTAAEKVDGAEKSQMFGKPCYKLNGKAFCCFYENEMVFKLNGEAHADALSYDGTHLFDPSGKNRPMKEWVQVSYDYKEKWDTLSIEAANYVASK